MLYMLDTNMCSYIIRDNPKGIFKKLKEIEQEHTVGLSSIVVSELLYGAKKRGSAKLSKIVSLFIEQFVIYDYDKASAHEYAKIRTTLEKKGQVIGVHDMLISAHALSVGATIVTNNTKEFVKTLNMLMLLYM
jgi:tRNA(fMet)-specific endonuclease VapC